MLTIHGFLVNQIFLLHTFEVLIGYLINSILWLELLFSITTSYAKVCFEGNDDEEYLV